MLFCQQSLLQLRSHSYFLSHTLMGSIYLCYVDFSLVGFGNGIMTKRLMVPRRNREPTMVHTWLSCSTRAGIVGNSHDPLWNYTDVLSPVDLFLETISVLFVEVTKQHPSSLLDQKGIPLSCVVLFLLILVVTTHTSYLCVLCVKVKPWSFLVLENN